MLKQSAFGLLALVLVACQTTSTTTEIPEMKEAEVKAVTASTAASPVVTATSATPPNITGAWRSIEPEKAGNGRYATREYRLTPGHWEQIYTLAADKDMKKILFVLRSEGSYNFQGPSKIPGAYNASFRFTNKFLNLKTSDNSLSKEYGFNKCSLNLNKEKDISSFGCGAISRIAECSQEHEIVKLENNQLFMADRAAGVSLCSPEDRPNNLGFPLKKIL